MREYSHFQIYGGLVQVESVVTAFKGLLETIL